MTTAPRAPARSEVRSSGRVGTDLPVDLHVSELPAPLPARSRDLGVGGICIATASPFALKSVRRVVIALPSGPLTLDAEGRWQVDATGDDVVLSGLAFSNPPPEAIETLSSFVLDNVAELARFLCAQSELRDFGLEEILGLAQITRFTDVPAGRFLYRQGTSQPREDSIYIVARGSICLQVRARNAREVTLARLSPGQVLGGMPLLAETPHSESAVAENDCRLLEINRDSFRYLESARPWLAQRLAFAVVRTYTRRLHDVIGRLRDHV